MNLMRSWPIILLFFLSGFTSLVYQSVWIRTLSLGVGSTSTSMSIVLSIFFLGLSLGSYFTGKHSQKIKKPLIFYGVIEGAIGVYAVVLLYVLYNFHGILAYLPLQGSLGWLGTLLKFFLVFLFLILPTLFMGASLPLLVKLFAKDDNSLGQSISLLYGLNTLGAVAGAFTTGFFLIPKLGISGANHLAAIVNVGILGLAFILQKRIDYWIPKVETSHVPLVDHKKITLSRPAQLAILATCGITGLSSIASEVVWNKYLGIFFGTNIFGLSIILSLFLLGLALGSLILSTFIERVKNLINLYLVLLILSAATTFAASVLLNWAPVMSHVVAYYAGESISLLTIKSIFSGFILFLPASLFGAILPLAIRLLTSSSDQAAEKVGLAYSINTVGSILGSCLAGLIFIPLLGSDFTIWLSVTLLIGVFFVNLYFAKNQLVYKLSLGTLAALLLTSSLVTQNIDFTNILKSAYVQSSPQNMSFTDAIKYFSKDYEEYKLIVEGKTGIISLSHDPNDGDKYKEYFRLKTNGLNESIYDLNNLSILPKYEALLALLPYTLTRNPKKAFVVGYGGGYSVDFLTSTGIDEVFVSELEEGIIQAAHFAYNNENPVLKRENLNLKIEDARFVLGTKQQGPFDIIISQPSHSWLSGVANLFTLEYFEVVKSNLTEQGVFSQWLNLYNMNREVLKSILKSFYTVFPHGAIFTQANDEELIMIGSRKPVKFNFSKLESLSRDSSFTEKLSRIPFNNPYDLLSHLTLTRDQVMNIVDKVTLNTDRNAYAEVRQSQLFYTNRVFHPGQFLERHYRPAIEDVVEGDISLRDLYKNVTLSLQSNPEYFRKYHETYKKYEELVQGDATENYSLGYMGLQVERYESAKEYLLASWKKKKNSDTFALILNVLTELRQFDEASQFYQKNKRYNTDLGVCYSLELFNQMKNYSESKKLVKKIEAKYADLYLPTCGDFLNKILGRYYISQGQYKEGKSFLELYLEVYPDDRLAVTSMMTALIELNEITYLEEYAARLTDTVKSESDYLNQLAEFFKADKLVKDAAVLETKASSLK